MKKKMSSKHFKLFALIVYTSNTVRLRVGIYTLCVPTNRIPLVDSTVYMYNM